MKRKTADPPTLDLTNQELRAWLERMKGLLLPADFAIMDALLAAYLYVRAALAAVRVSVVRMRRVFGLASSEKRRDILGKGRDPGHGNSNASPGAGEDRRKKKDRRSKRKGHGRRRVEDYIGARRIPVPHDQFYSGCPCPDEHCDGKVYPLRDPRRVLRIVGQPTLVATIWEVARWRCQLCERIFTAELPVEAGTEKYDATAVAMVAILHFGNGFAFYRLERFQASLGVPLPASHQSALLSAAYQKLFPVLQAMIRCAAQCEILHNDDTGMRVLTLLAVIKASQRPDDASSKSKKERTGIHTTAIVAITAAFRVALYFTGRKHAGENLADVLEHRDPSLVLPIHVSDGLDHNNPKGHPVRTAKCLTHGRRQFVDIVSSFPEETRQVVEDLGKVYQVDAIAREQKLSPEERLLLHQEKSGPVMDGLRRWLTDQLLADTVEPNSSLGKAIAYMLKRWVPLTAFLREPGAPLDNNIAERVLKLAIRHRKNSLFYKTERGAAVGDFFMSIIETCALNKVDAFHYLTALLRNADRLQESPESWMPWNYRAMLGEETGASTAAEGRTSTRPVHHPPSDPCPPLAAEGTVQVDTT